MSEVRPIRRLAVLTSGGDAPGMNAALRAVVRTALDRGIEVFAVREGFEGLLRDAGGIERMTWASVGGILQKGGTEIGTARSEGFRTPEGRRRAAAHLVRLGVHALIVIGGDGSLTGADEFRREWPEHLAALAATGDIPADAPARHAALAVVGLVGSIDNDMPGTDMTIGADSALHRIVDAIDAISSTAASHQRTFVVEVMGRRCGYLALMGALAAGADWVFLPESPPALDDWAGAMCRALKAGREAGRRDSIVVLAEGARDRRGREITTADVKRVLEERLGQDVRETVLGHVQRGGSPTAFDRVMSTTLGYEAVGEAFRESAHLEARLLGVREGRTRASALVPRVARSREIASALDAGDYDRALALRGEGFGEAFALFRTLAQAGPRPAAEGDRRPRLAILNAGAPAPGMNTATRAAARLALDRGLEVVGVRHGFRGLERGEVAPLSWMDVAGLGTRGGSELGTNRWRPGDADFPAIARTLEEHGIEALLVIGGRTGYQMAHALASQGASVPAFDIPLLCLPASIANDLPGSDLSVGADTALNSIVRAVDAIKQSAVASQRAFVVEVMGGACGYLPLLAGLATGAERVYLPEEPLTLADLKADVENLVAGFEAGKRLGLTIRGERAHEHYTTAFMVALFEEEGGDLFDVRQAILGHLQQGGDPSPYDRILATRLAARAIRSMTAAPADDAAPRARMVGLEGGHVVVRDLRDLPQLVDPRHGRPTRPGWLDLRRMARVLAQPAPSADAEG